VSTCVITVRYDLRIGACGKWTHPFKGRGLHIFLAKGFGGTLFKDWENKMVFFDDIKKDLVLEALPLPKSAKFHDR
jgi:hypothetical protein